MTRVTARPVLSLFSDRASLASSRPHTAPFVLLFPQMEKPGAVRLRMLLTVAQLESGLAGLGTLDVEGRALTQLAWP